jgi:uncharacterized membrane protein YbhN (UPF0104 family)
MTRKALGLRLLQAAFVVAVLWFGLRLLGQHWEAVRALGATLTPSWGQVTLSVGLVLVSYVVLIATWRAMVRAWGAALPPLTAARIWFVSNLGRYVPGKVWQIGAMGVMATDAGVPAAAAVGSSLVIALVNVLVGFGVVAATGAEAFAVVGAAGRSLWIPMTLLALVVASLPWALPPLVQFTGRVTGRPVDVPALPAAAVWMAAAGCIAAWVLYGSAFALLASGLLGGVTAGDAFTYVAVFTLSYLAGFLALFAPGGLGVREVAMGALLVGTGLATGAEATLLVVASRLWLTLLEIVPGLLFLAWPSPRRPAPPAP